MPDVLAQDSTLSYFSSEKEGAIIGIDAVRENNLLRDRDQRLIHVNFGSYQ